MLQMIIKRAPRLHGTIKTPVASRILAVRVLRHRLPLDMSRSRFESHTGCDDFRSQRIPHHSESGQYFTTVCCLSFHTSYSVFIQEITKPFPRSLIVNISCDDIEHHVWIAFHLLLDVMDSSDVICVCWPQRV